MHQAGWRDLARSIPYAGKTMQIQDILYNLLILILNKDFTQALNRNFLSRII
jgi:hypothetical protein